MEYLGIEMHDVRIAKREKRRNKREIFQVNPSWWESMTADEVAV